MNDEIDKDDKAFIMENFVDFQHSQHFDNSHINNISKTSLSDMSHKAQTSCFTLPKYKFKEL